MLIREVLEEIFQIFPDAYYITTCGYITREVYNYKDSSKNFYVLGSMGMVSSFGLGLAYVKPESQVIVLDGDGSFLMNVGGDLMVKELGVKNMIHIVLDNQMYESTGGQNRVNRHDFTEIAKSIGYDSCREFKDKEDYIGLEKYIKGSSFLHCHIEPRKLAIGKRVEYEPKHITKRFMKALRE